MPWSNRKPRAGTLRPQLPALLCLAAGALCLVLGAAWAWPKTAAAAEPASTSPVMLSVSAPDLNYRVEILTRKNRPYVGLVELLEPLGQVRGLTNGKQWQMHFRDVDAEFHHGKDKCVVGGRELKLDGPFLLENGHGLVPASSLFALLTRMQTLPVSYQESARQVFLGSAVPGANAKASVPTPAPTTAPVQAAPAPVATPTPAPTPVPAPATPAAPVHRFTVLVDASHGGADPGASLGEKDAPTEKQVVLEFARRLRSELESRGMAAIILRDGDVALSSDQRASMANSSRPDLYIVVHASNFGSGVRVLTAVPPAGEESHGPFLPWNSAQMGALSTSREAARTIATALGNQKLPVHVLAAPLPALNQATTPAIGIEFASPDGRELALPAFQLPIAAALATGVANARPGLEGRPAEVHP